MGEWRNYSQGTEEKGLPVRPKKIRVGGGGKIAPGENGGRNWERRKEGESRRFTIERKDFSLLSSFPGNL